MATCYIVGAGDFTARGFAPGPGDLILAADGGYRALYRLGTTPDLLLGDFDSLGDAPLPPDLPVLRFPARKDDTDTGLALRHGLMLGFRDFALYGCAGGRTDHLLANFQSMARVSRLGATIRLAAPDYDAWALTAPVPCAAAAANPCAAASRAAAPCAAAPCAAAPCAVPGTCAPPPCAAPPRHPSAAPRTPPPPRAPVPRTPGNPCAAPNAPATLALPPRPGGTVVSVFCHGDRAEGVTLTGLAYPLSDAVLTGDVPLGVSNRRLDGQPATVAVRRGALLILQEA